MLRALAFGALGLFAVSATALTGDEIVHYCESNACGGYFVGAFDALRIASAVGGSQSQRALAFCPPEPVEDEQIVEVALDYLQSHPEARHLQAANLTLRAWREQWPCR